MTDILIASCYLGLITFILLRTFLVAEDVPKNTWLRDILIAVCVGVAVSFIPIRSGPMGILLAIGFLIGTLGLSAMMIRKWRRSATSFAITLLVMFCLVLVAMFAMAVPLLLMARI